MSRSHRKNGGLAFVLLFITFLSISFIIFTILDEDNVYLQIQSAQPFHSNIFSLDNVGNKTWRTAEDKIAAIEQVVNGKGKIIIFEYAGCCGQILREWFLRIRDKLQQVNGLETNAIEITIIDIGNDFHSKFGMRMHEYLTHHSRDAFLMICVHHPIQRILAQYDHEWRWRCKQSDGCGPQIRMQEYDHALLTKHNYMAYTNQTGSATPHRFASIDLDEFLWRIIHFEIEQKSDNQELYQMFLNNHYLWSMCCHSQPCSMLHDIEWNAQYIEQCMHYAKHVLQSFDMVFVKEWMHDIRMQHLVNELFFKDNNVDDQKHKFVALSHKKTSVAASGVNHMFDPAYEEVLEQLNRHDLMLYEWVKDLVFNRTHIIWQEAKHNTHNRNELIYDLGHQYIVQQMHNIDINSREGLTR